MAAARLFAVFVLLWHSVLVPPVALGNGNYSCEIFCDRGITDLNDVVAGKSPCLNFDGNKLRTVSGYLSFSPWVEILILSNNQISLVEENSLLFMDRLTSLDLSHNRLQTFPWNVSLSNLTSLLLTFNQLTSLPTETALGTSLRVLNLAYNNLTSVPGQLFFKHVMMVALKGNPWHCDCRLTVLQDWLLLRYHPDATCESSYVRDDVENGSVGPEPISQCAGSEDIPWMFDPPSCVTPARLQDQCVIGGNFCETSCHGKMQPYEVIPGLNNHIMVRVGKDLVLKCASPTNQDGGLTEWFHPRAGRINGGKVPSQSFCTDEHGNLVMKNIRAGDAGIYICASRHALTLQGYVNVTVLDNFERETPFWDPNFTISVTTDAASVQSVSSPQPISSTHQPNDTKDSARHHSNVTTDTPIYGPTTVPTRSEREGVIELTVSEVTSSAATVRWVTPPHLRGSFLRLFYHERQEGETGRIWMDKEQRSVLIKPGFRRHQLRSLQASTCYVVCISSHTLPGPDECARFRTAASGLSPLYLAVIPVPLVGLLALGCYVKIRNKRRQIRRQYLNPFQTLAENTWNSLSLFGPGVDAVSLRRSAGDYHIYAVPNDDAYDDVCDVVLDPGSSAASYHPRPSYPCGDAQEPIYARACTVKKTVREGRRSANTNAAGKILLRRGSGSYEKACSVTLPMFKIPLPKADPSEAGSVYLNSVYTRACSVRSSYADPSSSQSIVGQHDAMRGKASSGNLYVSPVDVSRTRLRGIEDSSAPQDHVFVDVSTESLASSDDVSLPGWEEEEQAGYMQVDTPFRDFARSDATFSNRPVSW